MSEKQRDLLQAKQKRIGRMELNSLYRWDFYILTECVMVPPQSAVPLPGPYSCGLGRGDELDRKVNHDGQVRLWILVG